MTTDTTPANSPDGTPKGRATEGTHMYVLLDRSGSMASIANDVIGGYNTLLREQQADGADARVTLVQFDSQDPQEVVVAGAPIREMAPLDGNTFTPRGSTPLLDATGLLIGRARVEQQARVATGLAAEHVVFVTITDGEENCSREYDLERIRALVAECEAAGWTFVYISAALDAYGDALRFGVGQGNIQSFSADSDGTALAFASVSRNMRGFRDKKRRHMDTSADEFFEDKEAELDRRRKEGGDSF